eukprot:tig00020553_g10636.t1
MGRIVRLEISDFKSYAGHQIVGPFRNFTCIIGPNGAGKSNLMEAISFVLGVRSRDLRSTNLKDLIFCRDGDTVGKRKAFVKLVYENDDGEELHFTRTITASGQTQYSIGNTAVTWDEYDGKLRQQQILVKARNFLVFQGDVESIAQKNPKELTNLFEQISGSEELKKKYEEALEAKDKAEQNTSFAFSKKKGVTAERKQYKEQKEEAERYHRLQDEVADKKLQLFLFELHFIDQALKKETSALSNLNKELSEAETRATASQEHLKEKKKAQATLQKEVLKIEKSSAAVRSELESKRPELEKIRQGSSRLEQKIETNKRSRERIQEDLENQTAEVKKLEDDLDIIVQQLEDMASEASQGTLQTMDKELEEYSRLKEELVNKTATDQAALGEKNRMQKTDKDDLEAKRIKLQSLERQVADMMKTQATYERDREETEAKMTATSERISQLKKERQDLVSKFQQTKAKRDELTAHLKSLDEQLAQLKNLRRETDKEKDMTETVATLRRLFPAVHGRLSDLCKPSQRKYNRAATVVMGKNMDSVVVETEAVARDCMKYLKDQQKPPMTFLPLDTLRNKAIDEGLRQLGGTTKLLVDILTFELQYQKAVVYAVGNTVVFDTLDEARRLAFRPEQRLKAVTLDGVQINKSGIMTGGSSGGSDRWDEKEAQTLKEKRDTCAKELHELNRSISFEEQAAKLQNDVVKLEGELKHLKIHKDDRGKKVKMVSDDLAKRKSELAVIQPQVKQLESVGVENIEDYENKKGKLAQERSKVRMEMEAHKSRLQNDLQYKKSRKLETPLRNINATISNDEEELRKAKKQEGVVTKAISKLEKELAGFEKQVQDLGTQIGDIEAEAKVFRKEEAEASKRVGDAKRKLTAKETEIEKYKTKRHAVFQRCNLEEVRLPVLSEDDMEIDSGQEPGPSTSQAREEARPLRIDYEKLDSDLKNIAKQEAFDKAYSEIEAEIKNLQVEMERIAPNMNAIARLEDVTNRLKETTELFDQHRKESEEATRNFNQIRQERYDRFMQAFNHISERIDKVYKDLTKSKDHPTGGSATLVLEDPEEPYNKGIQFTSMPPLKRFRGMEQLSGGEKTVAALALLFAIHSYQPSPFFVLDEVDAALDNINVNRVANYIRKRTMEDQDFQAIVISLKDTFYEKAEALIGIHKDSQAFVSGTLTLDLSQYS